MWLQIVKSNTLYDDCGGGGVIGILSNKVQ